jgi:hypothetical protein
VKDLIVKLLPQPFFKVFESGLTGNVLAGDPGVKTKVFPASPSCSASTKAFMSAYFSRWQEEMQQKKADGIVGKTDQAIFMRDDRTDEGKIYQ